MTDQEILAGIEQVARQHVGWTGQLDPQMDLIEDLELDSLRILNLAVELENYFRIQLDQEDGADLRTVRDLVAAISRRLAENQL
jgi:acyl carrier protein